MNNITPMVRPSLRAARILYCTEMTRSNGRVVPLGVFCEIKLPHGHGLALKARSALSAEEAALIAPIFRAPLTNPFGYLATEFDLAWDNFDGTSALGYLANKHSTALSVLAPYEPAAERGAWYRGLFGEPEVQAKLKSAVNREFDLLLADFPPPADSPAPQGEPPVPVVRLQLAA